MSYIIGLVRERIDGQWETTIQRAQIKMYLDLVRPVVQVLDVSDQRVEFLQMSQVEEIHFDAGHQIYALVFRQTSPERFVGLELHSVYGPDNRPVDAEASR